MYATVASSGPEHPLLLTILVDSTCFETLCSTLNLARVKHEKAVTGRNAWSVPAQPGLRVDSEGTKYLILHSLFS